MNNITKIKNCFGCGVCSASCPKKIISIRLNKNGFYVPYIDDIEKCINCGICLDVCAFNHQEIALKEQTQKKGWAAWSGNPSYREKCSSGGIAYEISKHCISNGYNVVACRYNPDKQRAEHYIATNLSELEASIGSKYIQSFTEDAFKCINFKKQKYLVIGTPCQIDSIRRMIHKFNCEDNFVLMDFFCHCVPSMFAWSAYLKLLEPKTGDIINASWRNKTTGWHDSWVMKVEGEQGTSISRRSKGDLFYKLFLGDLTLGPQCQHQCKYKLLNSSADIRVGDFWGNTYKEDEHGVSALISITEKGREIIEHLKNATLVSHSIETVTEGQMKNNAKPKTMYPYIMYALKKGWGLKSIPFLIFYNIQSLINVLAIRYKKLTK